MSIDLETAATRAREVYCRAMRNFLGRTRGVSSDYGKQTMPRWDGGERPSDGKRFKPVWPKLAAAAQSAGVSVDDLVETAFGRRRGGEAPTPDQCCAAEVVEICLDPLTRSDKLEKAARMLSSQSTRALTDITIRCGYGIDAKAACRSLLLDERFQLTPLFRYCLARSEGLSDLADRFHTRAAAEYMTDSDVYEKTWSKLLPVDWAIRRKR